MNDLSVIIPVYNEQDSIYQIIEKTNNLDFINQIICINDGSTDNSAEIIDKFKNEKKITTISHKRNRGKGNTIRTGLTFVTSEYVAIQDGDNEYNPKDLERLLALAKTTNLPLIMGSRRMGIKHPILANLNPYHLCVTLINLLVFILFSKKISDEATCYKVFKTSYLRSLDLTCERFEFCPEVVSKTLSLGYHIPEIPISYKRRSKSDGKKISFRDAIDAFRTIWKHRNWGLKNPSLSKAQKNPKSSFSNNLNI